jgi:hypothetical protein
MSAADVYALAWYSVAGCLVIAVMAAADLAWAVLSAPVVSVGRRLACWLGLMPAQAFKDSLQPVKGGDAF